MVGDEADGFHHKLFQALTVKETDYLNNTKGLIQAMLKTLFNNKKYKITVC